MDNLGLTYHCNKNVRPLQCQKADVVKYDGLNSAMLIAGMVW